MIDIKYIIKSLINRIDLIVSQYNMGIEVDEQQLKYLCEDNNDVINEYGIEYTNIQTLPFIISRKNNKVITSYFLPLTKENKIYLYTIHDDLYPYNEGNIINEYTKKVNDKKDECKLDYSNYGLPKDKLYPLNNKEDVMEAIRHFKYCPEGKMKELSININNAIEDFNMKLPLSYYNPFYPLINQSALIKDCNNDDNLDITIESMNNPNYIWGYEKELELMNQSMQNELEIPQYYNKYISHMIDYRQYFEESRLSEVLIVIQNLTNLTYSRISKFSRLRKCPTDISNEDIFRISNTKRFRELFIKRNVEGINLLFGISSEGSLYWILTSDDESLILIPLIRNSEIHENMHVLTNVNTNNTKIEIVNFKKKSNNVKYKKLSNDIKIDAENIIESLNNINYKDKDDALALFVLHESNFLNDLQKLDIKNKFKKSIREISRDQIGFNFHNHFITSPLLEYIEIGELDNPVISKLRFNKLMR